MLSESRRAPVGILCVHRQRYASPQMCRVAPSSPPEALRAYDLKDDGPQNAKESGTCTDDDVLFHLRQSSKAESPEPKGLGHSYPRGGANVAPRRSTSVPK
jgi:hypothetical protein